MTFWLVLAVNSVTFGGLLFLLSAGFSLIFGLMRIPNLTHGSLFMLGAYFGATFIIGVLGGQLLGTLGLSFMVADFCLMVWGGDPLSVETPPALAGFTRFGVAVFRNTAT